MNAANLKRRDAILRRFKLPAALVAITTMLLVSVSSAAAFSVIPAGEPEGFVAETSTTQAGAAADGTTSFTLTPPVSGLAGDGKLQTTIVDLPPGLVGNPRALPQCTRLTSLTEPDPQCPLNSLVGEVSFETRVVLIPGVFEFTEKHVMPLWNMAPQSGDLAGLAFQLGGTVSSINIRLSLRPDDHGVRAVTERAPRYFPITKVTITVWGVPGDDSHDEQRCKLFQPNSDFDLTTKRTCSAPANTGDRIVELSAPHAFEGKVAPFFTNPTACDAPKITHISVSSWDEPNIFSSPEAASAPTPTGCSQVEFDPSIAAKPTTNLADSPSGLDFNLHIPQNDDPDGLATAYLKDAVVGLPQGMTVNPPSADGLDSCSLAQIGLKTDSPVSCPDASKIGSVTVTTPALENPVQGAVYLAKQNENPFHSLLALYIVLEDKERGLLVKLPGEAKADPRTGQLTAVFRDNPQLPVEDLELHLKQGPRAPLKTPATCGAFTTTTEMTPWSSPEGADATPSDSFELTQGPGGSACLKDEAAAPNRPSFSAGTVDPTAGAFSPFVLRLARADGTQQVRSIDTTLPEGLIGKLAGISYCSDSALDAAASRAGKAEQAGPSCPVASRVGSVDLGAGAGSTPLHVGAKAYLAGPYKGAPLSLAIITPAVAGPFDLGVVVVRTALYVDPSTAQIHAVSDQIPTILEGIPLNVRSVSLQMDKPNFTLNPTSCAEMSIRGAASSVFDQVALLSNRFQVGDCAKLGFKPSLSIKLKGGTKRNKNPALTAVVTYPKGSYANIARAAVTLPHSEFLDNEHIQTICTRVQFAADACPAASIYGHATAITPLLDQPLSGPVYLRSSDNELPDLVADLNGQIEVELAGRIDTGKGGGIRNTFEMVPDAPVSKFTLKMQGGKKSLLVNSENICKKPQRVTVSMTAHNGKAYNTTPLIANDCAKKSKKKPHGKRHPKRTSHPRALR